MASFNKVFILGNLGRDPELRYSPKDQTPVATLNVATTESWTGRDGQSQEQTEWHRVVVWGRQAENCGKYLTKGRSVLVEGRLQTRSWDDKATGQKRYTTEIRATQVQFVSNSGQRSDFPSGGNPEHEDRSRGSFEEASSSFGSGTSSPAGFPQADSPSTASSSGNGNSYPDTGLPDLADIPF